MLSPPPAIQPECQAPRSHLTRLLDITKYNFLDPLIAHVRATRRSRQLVLKKAGENLATSQIVCILVVKNEAGRMRFILDHYSKLGVDHFIIVDNMSSDDLEEYTWNMSNVTIYQADGQFKDARYGTDWVNYILRKKCNGKWILWVDADETLIFSSDPDRTLIDLTVKLDNQRQHAVQAVLLDMYSSLPSDQNIVSLGQNPIGACSLYDESGYFSHHDPTSQTNWIKGGVRGRVFFSSDVWAGPALNKTPLVRWQRHFSFLRVTHLLWPPYINGNGKLESVLLHFKFTAISIEKIQNTSYRTQHTNEYRAYDNIHESNLVDRRTRKFYSNADLVNSGLFYPLV